MRHRIIEEQSVFKIQKRVLWFWVTETTYEADGAACDLTFESEEAAEKFILNKKPERRICKEM